LELVFFNVSLELVLAADHVALEHFLAADALNYSLLLLLHTHHLCELEQ
jgi:hypothetical protein